MSEHPFDLIALAARARREQRLDDAYAAYRQAADAADADAHEDVLVAALTGLGRIERDRGFGDLARQHYADALVLCRRGADALLTAHVAGHLGDIERENGATDRAAPLLAEAVAMYHGNLDTKVLDLANAIRPLALAKAALGDVDGAGALWREAQVLYAAVGVSAGTDECGAQAQRLRRVE